MKRFGLLALWSLMIVLAGCSTPQTNRQEANLRWEEARHKINYQLAKEQYDNGDSDACMKQLNKIFSSNTPYAPAYLLAAKVAILDQDYVRAYDLVGLAIDAAPESADGYHSLALLKEHEGDLDAALEAMDKAFAYDMRNPEYVIYLSELQIRNGDHDLALATLQTGEKLYPSHVGLQSAAADLYSLRGEYGSEIACLRRMLRIDPEDQGTRRRMAIALAANNQPAQAIPLLERSLKESKANDQLAVRAALADSYIRVENYPQAERELVRLCKAQPGQASWQYQLAEVQVAQGRDAQALERLAEVLQLEPEHGEAHALAGYLYFTRGELTMAEPHLRAAVDKSPQPQLAAVALVRTLNGLGRKDEAHEVWAEFGEKAALARESGVPEKMATSRPSDWQVGRGQ